MGAHVIPGLCAVGLEVWGGPIPEGQKASAVAQQLIREKISATQGRQSSEIGLLREPSGRLVLSEGDDTVRFSIAHAPDYVVVSIGIGFDVGVDVERLDRRIDPRIVVRCSTSSELAALAELTGEAARTRFLESWVTKEAISKMLGLGLRARFADIETGAGRAAGIVLQLTQIGESHVAAVAIKERAPYEANVRRYV